MQVREIMTPSPTCCGPDTCLRDAARMMVDQDCGAIPVVDETNRSMRLLGMVTDRDIAIRAVAAGKTPGATKVKEVMSHPIVSVPESASFHDCLALMEENQLRRAPVVDAAGNLVGIVSQADVARTQSGMTVCELVHQVSIGFDSAHPM